MNEISCIVCGKKKERKNRKEFLKIKDESIYICLHCLCKRDVLNEQKKRIGEMMELSTLQKLREIKKEYEGNPLLQILLYKNGDVKNIIEGRLSCFLTKRGYITKLFEDKLSGLYDKIEVLDMEKEKCFCDNCRHKEIEISKLKEKIEELSKELKKSIRFGK